MTTTNDDPLAGVPAINRSDNLMELRRLVEVPSGPAGYQRNPGRWDGPSHWHDLLKCCELFEHIAWERQQYNDLRARVERLRAVANTAKRVYVLDDIPAVRWQQLHESLAALEPGDLE